MTTQENFFPINNEVQHGSLDELAEELKAMRFAFAVLYTQLPKGVQSGIVFQLKEVDLDASKRLAEMFSQLDGISPGSHS